MCVTAGVPLPTIFVSDHDLSAGAPPVPGLGRTQCVVLNARTGASFLRSAIRLGELAVELFP